MKLNSIEFTNHCNLRCSYCPVGKPKKQYEDGVDYPKGHLSLKNYLEALKFTEPYPAPPFTGLVRLGVHGEALLHPNFIEYVKIAVKFGVNPYLHTNGLLLTDEMCKEIITSGLKFMQVSIHAKRSLEKYMRMFDLNEQAGSPVEVLAEANTENIPDLKKWFQACNPEEKHLKKMRVISAHNWAMDPPKDKLSTDYFTSRCDFLRGDLCVMKWDGSIVSCCYDFEGVNKIGHIDNFESLHHKKEEYKLCNSCSLSWVNNNNNVFYPWPHFLQFLT